MADAPEAAADDATPATRARRGGMRALVIGAVVAAVLGAVTLGTRSGDVSQSDAAELDGWIERTVAA